MRIGVIGLGKMGEAIIQGLKKSGSQYESASGTTRSSDSANEAGRRLSIPCHQDNRKLVRESDFVFLGVKPHQAQKVLEEIQGELKPQHTLVSICASITLEQLKLWSGGKASIIRAMPNTPCLVGQGMTVLTGVVADDRAKKVQAIFDSVGRTAWIEESLMDGATGLSGCGPAYVYLIIESLSEAGVKVGLPRKTATLLAAQTLLGASQMVLEQNAHPASLKDEVTTPAGCTIDGLMALEEGKLRVTLIKAVLAATKRSRALRKAK